MASAQLSDVSPLMQPVVYNGQPYSTSQYVHQQYLATRPRRGKYRKHADFLQLVRGLHTYADSLALGNIVELSWSDIKTRGTQEPFALRPLFRSAGYNPLTLLDAIAQAALYDAIRTQMDVALTKAAQHFWARVNMLDGCWFWQGSTNGYGYGQLCWQGKVRKAYRVAWELAWGMPPPAGLCVCHTCDVNLCVNPGHLWLGTHRQNMEDMQRKGRASGEGIRAAIQGILRKSAARTHCKRGHSLAGNVYRNRRHNARQCKTCRAIEYQERKTRQASVTKRKAKHA